jgi:hypothetical protein
MRTWAGSRRGSFLVRSDRTPADRRGLFGAFCGEGACPPLGCAAAPIRLPLFIRQTAAPGFRAAAQPSGTSPLATRSLPHPRTYCGPPSLCGERACPALGGEATPTGSPCSTRHPEVAGFGAAAQPSGGRAPSPQGACRTPGLTVDHRLYVASGLAPRWVAKPPQPPHHAPPDTPRWQDLGLLRTQRGCPLATKAPSPQVRYRRCWCALSLRPAYRSLPTARGCRDPRDETPA